jgi:hypothetical protein
MLGRLHAVGADLDPDPDLPCSLARPRPGLDHEDVDGLRLSRDVLDRTAFHDNADGRRSRDGIAVPIRPRLVVVDRDHVAAVVENA